MKHLIGVQPTGKLHIGNYLGCLKKGLEYQNEGHDVTFLLANYHSLTTDTFDEVTKSELIRLGCKKVIEQTPEYTELFFKLCCKLNLGTLTKMPQFKEKSETVEFNLGLLLYPVLMIADIMINDPDVVIIGRDQLAHLELCNDITKRLGGRSYQYEFGHLDKVMSLQDPTKKMSKSLGEKHVLYLFDEDYGLKIRKANTTPEGFENLRKIGEQLELDYVENTPYSDYKRLLAIRMEEYFDNP